MFITMKTWITFIIHIEGPIRSKELRGFARTAKMFYQGIFDAIISHISVVYLIYLNPYVYLLIQKISKHQFEYPVTNVCVVSVETYVGRYQWIEI